MEEISYRIGIFNVDGIAGSQHDYIHWLPGACTGDKAEPREILTAEAIDIRTTKLRTPLQVQLHLDAGPRSELPDRREAGYGGIGGYGLSFAVNVSMGPPSFAINPSRNWRQMRARSFSNASRTSHLPNKLGWRWTVNGPCIAESAALLRRAIGVCTA